MHKILITGGTGFLGAYLAEKFAQSGTDVFLAVRSVSNYWRFEKLKLNSKISFVQIPLISLEEWRIFIAKEKIDTVIHLATYGSYPHQTDIDQTIQTNLYESINFLKACVESTTVTRFISAGSGSEYALNDRPSRETDNLNSPTIYGRTKSAFGLVAEKICENSNVYFLHLRFFTIYGPYENPSRIIPRLISHGLKNVLPKLSNPKNARDFIFIEDVHNLIVKAMNENRSTTGTFNISSGKSLDLISLVGIVKKMFEISQEPEWDSFPSRSFDHPSWSGDNSQLIERFHWKPEIDIEEGLQIFTDWIENGPLSKDYSL